MSFFQKKSSSMASGDVFISYRRCNADLVKPIENELQRRNISYFIDRVGVDYGMDYSGIIARAVKQCKVLLVVWTQEADDSPDMLREIKMAFDNHKIVVPYKVGTFNVTDHDAIYYQLSAVNRYEVLTQTPSTIKELVNKIEKRLKDNNTPPTLSQPSVSPQPDIDIQELLVVDFEELPVDLQNSLIHQNSEEKCNRSDLSVPRIDAGNRKTYTIKNVAFAFRWCPAGTFFMGSPKSESGRYSDEKRHQVTLSKGFWIMETQVTQKQWKAIMGYNPSRFIGDDRPVDSISWNDCLKFCKTCSRLGMPVQLPTEAQWEYACRAGSSGAFAGEIDEMAWHLSNSGQKTHPVGMKKPNAWGLYDMHGNVFEWCQDKYGDYPSGSITDPAGSLKGSDRIYRGGSWFSYSELCRSACRRRSGSDYGNYCTGFRCVRK